MPMPAAANNGLPWSPDDVRALRELAAAGKSSTQVAEALGRTKIGIKSKALSLGIVISPRRSSSGEQPPPSSAQRTRDV
jgi:hypothetical protein